MRCDLCPLCPTAEDDACPISYSDYGIEHSDGMSGCKHPRNWVEKTDRMRDLQYLDVGEWYKEQEYNDRNNVNMSDPNGKYVREAIHCIGLDHKKPYVRHGKRWYKPYRNYFNTSHDDEVWTALSKVGYAKEYELGYYELIDAGIRWLGRIVDINIKQEEE